MERSARHTLHEHEDDWPLSLGIDDKGRSIHTCIDCGAEIPDGTCVERNSSGQVIAWQSGGTNPEGNPIRNIVHECGNI